LNTLLKIPSTDANTIQRKWNSFSELKNYCESIILNHTPTNEDEISLDAFRAWIQLRNDKQIDTGGGQNPGCYLNELSDGAYGYKATELSVAVNHEGRYGFWGNDGISMGYIPTRDSMCRPRPMGDNSQGGYTGIGTRTWIAKHGLPYFFLSNENDRYYIRLYRIEGTFNRFVAEQVGKSTKVSLVEYEITKEEYLLLIGYEKKDGAWICEFFNEIPTVFTMIRCWDDINTLLPIKSYNPNKIMQRVGEQQIEHDLKVNFYFQGEKYSKKTIFHPAEIKIIKNGKIVTEYGTKLASNLPLIEKDIDIYGDGSLWEVRGYTALAEVTNPLEYSKMMEGNAEIIDQYNLLRGGINRPRHGRVIYMSKSGSIHSIRDIGSSPEFLGVFLVVRRTSGDASYESGIKSVTVPDAVFEETKEAFKRYTINNGQSATVKKRPKKAEDTATEKIANVLESDVETDEKFWMAYNLQKYTDGDLTEDDACNSEYLHYGANNKFRNRQVDMMYIRDNDEISLGHESVAIFEFAFEDTWGHIDRVITWGSGKRMAKHVILVVSTFKGHQYKQYIKDHYVPQPGCNLIVTTYTDFQMGKDTQYLKL
jgi:hypothetical protein